MGAEREDTDPNPKRVGTEPGLGKASGASAVPRAAVPVEEDPAAPVDFDALHAALGDPVEFEELSSGPAIEKGGDSDPLLDSLEADAAAGGGVGESSGRSSATYSSARPRTIPPTRAPVEDPNAPAVIVASDTDTVPTAPPKMTMPLKPAPPPPFTGGQPSSNPHVAVAQAPSGPHGVAGHPSSGPHVASPPFTPQPFPVQGRQGQMTMRMPDRPAGMVRRAKTPTIVMRRRGPSARQKLVAFMAMLLLVTACGIAVIIWRKPGLLGLERPSPAPSASASAQPLGASSASSAVTAPSAGASANASALASALASGSPSASSSAKKVAKPAPAPPHSAGTAPR